MAGSLNYSIGSTGITVPSQQDLTNYYVNAFQTIYGAGINVGPETPDGQIIGISVQANLDVQELLVQIFNSFDPDLAFGTTLDQRVAINGIQRQAGTYTTTDITLVLTQSVNLYGLDQSVQAVYTVADNAGNNWQLQTTQLGIGPGTVALLFQSATPGAITTIPNTITNPVTIVLGVSSINNPTTYTSLGVNEETDAALKIRRQKSVSLPSQGYYNGLLAALENVPGVSTVIINENDTGGTSSVGVPGHSIWVIVGGSGSPANIAQAIYNERPLGVGLYNSGDLGANKYVITQADGSLFTVYWDSVVPQNLFIRFTATSLNGVTPPNIAAILSGLPSIFTPGVDQEVNINGLATDVQSIDPNTLVTNAGFSLSANGSYSVVLTPSFPNEQFAVSSANIIIIPIILSPIAITLQHLTSQQFSPLGGYGPYTYSVSVNNSGGSIGSTSGLYTAGSITGVADTILVTDSLSNTATSTVTVI